MQLKLDRVHAGFPKEMFPTPTHVVKYSYKANSSSPLGDDELTAVQGERVEFLDAHPNDAYASTWCRVRNEAGEAGYMPSSYLYALDQPITTLPWLESNVPEEKETSVVATSPTATAKPYVSAYNREAGAGTKEKSEEFYCDVCEREFNGPNPYRAHMSGKAHREQVEIQRYFQSTA